MLFTNILFLFLAMVIPSLLLPNTGYGVFASPTLSLISGVVIWLLLLCAIWIQTRSYRKLSAHALIFRFQIQTLIALAIANFYFDFLKPFYDLPFAAIIDILGTLIFYLGAVAWSHYLLGGWNRAKTNMLFIAPFVLSYVLLWLILEIPGIDSDSTYVSLGVVIAVSLAVMVYIPRVIQRAWQCTNLHESALKTRLDALCSKLKFKHAGLKTWAVMRDTHNAAIIGVIPKFRYVMFTENLVNHFPPNWVEAVLAHEIGHSKYRHLIIYPFITIGMMLITIFALNFAIDPIYTFFDQMDRDYPGLYWEESYFFVTYGLFALILGATFRLFFGFFSRLFERQADLYIFEACVDANHMVEALNAIGNYSGNIHDKPNWHHYSIRERMNFLTQASSSPTLIAAHHRKVRLILKGYFLALVAAFTIIIYYS
jgi:STE24 endopeptidase